MLRDSEYTFIYCEISFKLHLIHEVSGSNVIKVSGGIFYASASKK